MIADLTQTFHTLGEDKAVRVVVLQAEGVSFSAGADLAWMQRMAGYSAAENLADAAGLTRLMRTLDRLAKPTVAVVQGAAYGGGVGLVACCDVVVAAETAKFCLSEVKIGLIPAAIGPYVINAIGARQARRYFTTAEVFSAVRACEIGLVHEAVALAGLPAARDAIVASLQQGAPVAQAEAKALVFLCEAARLDDALADETGRRIAGRRASAEGREGLAAFLERRRPSWAPPTQGSP